MELDLLFDCSGVDWKTVSAMLRSVGMAYYEPEVHRKAFENSRVTVFAYHDGRLIGFGRALSDGAYQAAVYDVAVEPEFQGRGVGIKIMQSILARIPQCNVVLYAVSGKEEFYRSFGLRTMKTGMALFKKAELMKERGFTE